VPVSLTIFQCRPKHPSRRLMPHYGAICRHPLGTALTWMPGPEDRDQPQVVDLRGRKRDELGGHGQKKRKKRRCTRPWARHLGRQAPEKHCVGTIAVPVGARSKGRSASRDWGLDECTAICAHQGGQRNRVALALFDGCEPGSGPSHGLAWPTGDLAKGRRWRIIISTMAHVRAPPAHGAGHRCKRETDG
jgi:hypothetical protein